MQARGWVQLWYGGGKMQSRCCELQPGACLPPAAPVRDQAGPFFYPFCPLFQPHIVCVSEANHCAAFHCYGWSQGHPQQHPNLNLWQPTQGIQLMHMRESSTVWQEAFPAINKYIRNCFTYLSLFMADILSDMSQSPRSASASWNLVTQKVGPGWCVHKVILQGILLRFNFSPGMLSSLGCPCSQCRGTGPFEGHFRDEAQR